MLIWVPTAEAAAALDGLRGATVEQVAPDGSDLPASAGEVEFYVPPFFPTRPAIAAMRQMPRLAAVQALTAGVDGCCPNCRRRHLVQRAGRARRQHRRMGGGGHSRRAPRVPPFHQGGGGGAVELPVHRLPGRQDGAYRSVTARSAPRSSSGWPALRSPSEG